MLSKKICQYLIDFLVGSLWVQSEGDDRFQRRFEAIGYTDDPEHGCGITLVLGSS